MFHRALVARNGTGVSVECSNKTITTYAWEDSPGFDYEADAKAYWGCLNIGCCQSLKEFLDDYDWIAITFLALVCVACFVGMVAALYLRRETTVDQDKILLHPWSKYIFAALLAGVIGLCIIVAAIANTGQYGAITPEEEVEARTHNAMIKARPKATTTKSPATASCNDGAYNGLETDVDCGGNCDMNCGLNRGCNNVTDCVADLYCYPHSPLSPTCFTKYCHPGQAANVFGTCQELNPEISCNNGERSETETDVDCGAHTSPPDLASAW